MDFNPNLDDPKTQLLITMGLGLLGGAPGTKRNFGADMRNAGLLGMQAYGGAKQAQMQQQTMERANRASDLQEALGVQGALQQNELPAMIEAYNAGKPYVPSDGMQAINKRVMQLALSSNLSGMIPGSGNLAPVSDSRAQSAPPPQPQQPPAPPVGQNFMGANPNYTPPQPSPQSAPQLPPQGAPRPGSIPTSIYGVPLPIYSAASKNPGVLAYLNQVAKSRETQNMRPGGTAYGYDETTGKQGPLFYAPKIDAGIQPTFGPNGQVSVSPMPGYGQSIAGLNFASAGGKDAAASIFAKPDTIQTVGNPTLMTQRQQIAAASGKDPLAEFMRYLNGGANPMAPQSQPPPAPQGRPQIPPEVLAADKRGPFIATQAPGAPVQFQQSPSSGVAGLPLQDQTDSAAQAELGKGIGSQGVEIFKNGGASIQGQKLLGMMANMAKSYTPGVFQPLKAQVAAYATGMGVPEDVVNKTLGTNVGDIQGLTSAVISMAGKLTRQTDAQPSQLQFMKTLESMPSSARTAQGFQKIMQYLNDSHQYNIDEMNAFQKWLDDPAHAGSPKGFMAAWAKQANEGPYIWNTQSAKPAGRVIDFHEMR